MSDRNLLQISPNGVHYLRKLYNLSGQGRMEDAINILEKWINQENHILKKDFSKDYLERVLIMSKGSIEKTKKRIDALCTMRTLSPHLFSINNTKAEFQEIFNQIKLVPLPVITEDLYRIIILKIHHESFTQQRLLMGLQYSMIMAEYLSRHDYANGYIIVDDFRGLNILELVAKVATADLQQVMSILLNGFGSRLKSIHIVSESKVIDLIVNFIKQIISAKIANRIYVYKNFDELLGKNLPLDNFPADYGGKERDLNTLQNDWLDTLFSEENLDFYNHMKEARTDESLRSSEKFNKEYMGMPGSFRNLTVD